MQSPARTRVHVHPLTSSPDWHAVYGPLGIEIHVSPSGDSLPEAIDALLSKDEQHRYVIIEAEDDEAGWPVFILQEI